MEPTYNELKQEIAEYEASFDLRWKANMRAIKQWQKAHPGNDLVWPDHADLCVWLMEQLERKSGIIADHNGCKEFVEELRQIAQKYNVTIWLKRA